MKKYYTIYKITNNIDNSIYVGAHSTDNLNDTYMGSSKSLKADIRQYGINNFTKEILHIFDNMDEMINKELEIVDKEFCMRYDTYNIVIGGVYNGKTIGMVSVKDKNGKYSIVYKDDPRYLSKELIPVGCGMVSVVDEYNNKIQVSINDERYLNGYLKSIMVGKFHGIDKFGNKYFISTNDERYLSGEVWNVQKGISNPKRSKCFIGRKHTNETKKKISDKLSMLQRGELNSQYGKKKTDDQKKRISEKLCKEFYVYNLNGNFISKENNMKEYAKVNNLLPQKISRVCIGKQKFHKGYRFSYTYYDQLPSL